jgi:putative lipoic acid-binding regulatory protein
MSDPLEGAFPCEFPIKVVGRGDAGLKAAATAIVERHMGPLEPQRLRTRTSTDGNFLSLTFTVYAESRAQLDAVYRELTACEGVMLAL